MFPNLRLMIVAVLASILGISCALGLFAEFRVSHDSFLRESNASAPLQLSAGDTVPGRLVNTAAPFEFRFQAPEPPSPQPPAVAASAAAASAPAMASDVTSAVEPAAVPAQFDHAAAAPSPVATGSIAEQNSEQKAPQDSRQNTGPKAEDDLAAKTPAASPSVGTATPNSEIAPASTRTATPEKRRRITLRHRPIIMRRVQRTRPAAALQDFTTMQTPFQWAPQSASQSPLPVRRRIIRRLRPARKPVVQSATPQATVSNSSPADTPK